MKKILILFMMISCLSFAEKYKCKGDIEKDTKYMGEIFEPTLKKITVAIGLKDVEMLDKEKKNLEKVKEVIDHMLKEHSDDLPLEVLSELVKFKGVIEDMEYGIEKLENTI